MYYFVFKIREGIFLDIQGDFDNVEWRDIVLQLSFLYCIGKIAGVIRSCFSERSILVHWGAWISTHPQKNGCPRGSCLGPIFWLEFGKLGYLLFAFVDDFSFILSGFRRLDLESDSILPFSVSCWNHWIWNFQQINTKPLYLQRHVNFKENPPSKYWNF